MTNLIPVIGYLNKTQKEKMNKRKGELGIRFNSVYINMLIVRDLKQKNKF